MADPAAPGLDAAARCAGTPEPAAATTGPPEYGRLDRILAEQRAKPYLPDPQAWWLAPSVAERHHASVAEIHRLRAMLVALEAECAALTEALAEAAHEFEPMESYPRRCAASFCRALADAPVHRTPARVREELEGP